MLSFRPFKSYTWYTQPVWGPPRSWTSTPRTANNKTGVCGWPVTWPPGAPVMAELDPQWHLSEKLLLQGSGVGVGWESDRMGWDGMDGQMLKKNKPKTSWSEQLDW